MNNKIYKLNYEKYTMFLNVNKNDTVTSLLIVGRKKTLKKIVNIFIYC